MAGRDGIGRHPGECFIGKDGSTSQIEDAIDQYLARIEVLADLLEKHHPKGYSPTTVQETARMIKREAEGLRVVAKNWAQHRIKLVDG